MTTLDLNKPEGARKYIETFSARVMRGKEITRVQLGNRWIDFDDMTDEDALKVASSLYWDVEVPSRGTCQ